MYFYPQQRCSMHVYIMRHGDAALDATSDAQRPLTHCGCEENRQLASWLADYQSFFSRTLVSPYLRARQTLNSVQEVIPELGEINSLDILTPSGEPQQVSDYLHALALEGDQAVLVISHLPLVGYLVSALCPMECPPMFATSGIACIDYDPLHSAGRLLWQVSPAKLAAAM